MQNVIMKCNVSAVRISSSLLFFVFTVMDITDIAHGKIDDDDKQYFIPFQQ